MKKLFSFQEKALNNCEGFLFNSKLKSGLAIIPTAGGKSVIIAKLCKELRNTPTLIIVPSEELLIQNYNAIKEEGIEASLYSASVDSKIISNVTVATILSLKDKGSDFKKAGIKFVIIDEAHFKFSSQSSLDEDDNIKHSVFKQFLKDLSPRKLLGFTATPFILSNISGEPGLKSLINIRGGFFKDIIHITQVKEVIKENRWSKLIYDIHPVSNESLELNSNKTEFSKDSIKLFLQENNVNNRICLLLKKHQNKKTLTFVENVEVAKVIMNWYNSKDFFGRCAIVSADTNKKERKQIISDFKDINNDLNHVINFGTLTTGFDFPQLTILIGGRPTTSLSLYYQMLSRLVRVHESKKEGLYIDLVGNYERFGEIEKLNFDNIRSFKWACFSDDILLTDIPFTFPYKVSKDVLNNPPKRKQILNSDMSIWFGKFEGKKVKYLPNYYADFLIKNHVPSMNEKREALHELLLSLKHNRYLSIIT